MTKVRVSLDFFKKAAEKILKSEARENFDLFVSFAGLAEIKMLNRSYRKKDRPTDVLSFTYGGSGEIVICPQVVKENSEKFEVTFKKELCRVFVHGILHVLGYDHEKNKSKAEKMEKKTDYYLKLFTKK